MVVAGVSDAAGAALVDGASVGAAEVLGAADVVADSVADSVADVVADSLALVVALVGEVSIGVPAPAVAVGGVSTVSIM